MREDEFVARLQMLGVKYECMYARVDGEEVQLRYLSYGGRHAPIDLGDLHHVTQHTLRRISKQLGIEFERLTAALH